MNPMKWFVSTSYSHHKAPLSERRKNTVLGFSDPLNDHYNGPMRWWFLEEKSPETLFSDKQFKWKIWIRKNVSETLNLEKVDIRSSF